MFICIYAISASPVVSIDLFIELQADLSKAERNAHNNANAEAIKKQSQQSAFTEVPCR